MTEGELHRVGKTARVSVVERPAGTVETARRGDTHPVETGGAADVADVPGVVVECVGGAGRPVRRHGAEW